MNLFIIIIFNIYMYILHFSLNEEILLFFTFSLFFFIAIKALSSFLSKSINLIRYKIYSKFIKMVSILLKALQKNKKLFRVFYKIYLTNFILHYAINYYPDFKNLKVTKF